MSVRRRAASTATPEKVLLYSDRRHGMDAIESKIGALQEIYDRFEQAIREYKKEAVCEAGCAFCCSGVGKLDITTLEGVVIRSRIAEMPRPARSELQKKLTRNMRKKEQRLPAVCPFLQKNQTCRIYEIRPFSCRQLYSLEKCGEQGPTVHRRAVEMSRRAVAEIQRLDDTGYSGHISFVLFMLEAEKFRKIYLRGDFKPEEVMTFGKSRGIVINRMAPSLAVA